MTDKEMYLENKLKKKEHSLKIKKLGILKRNVNYRIVTLGVVNEENEDDYIALLSQLTAIENNITTLRRNKYISSAYEFIPNNVKL